MRAARAGGPRIALTMGDPAGIGPEIVARALADRALRGTARFVVYGDARVMERAVALTGAGLAVRGTSVGQAGGFGPDELPVVDLANADPAAFEPGRVSGLCGRASWEYIEAAAKAALAGEVDAIATAPINKEAIVAARVPFIGHTEMLAGVAGVADPLTMFETLGLRVFFLTRHVSLKVACELVKRPRIVDYLERCSGALAGLGVVGEIAVAGLNPHCGEHGLFGDEEEREVRPAVEEARSRGLAVAGPIGADSVFHQAKTGRYAAVLSLYHDQGHIACKTLDFERTVSLTLGLPFLRTSVDHGTAFDLAWKGEASAVSMVEAARAAARYA
ncbi:MAG TPA: 4-hydroxythreonine-4-phosphate dehydrogenase PdxA [Rectinemataceae bacterium]|nr:4-hydroxythreonine-4-phosphate dehydrogenase PdxA [Rectinemataceae bacterium]